MDVFEAVQQRRSIRSYQEGKPVPRKALEKILEAARLAPSARNTEPWHFIAVTNPEKRKALSKGVFAKFLSQAPLVIVACGDYKASPDWYAVDVGLAVENMVLTTTGEGLGTCCVGSFNEKDVKAALKIPENFEVIVLLAVGYSERRNLGKIQKENQNFCSQKTDGYPCTGQTFSIASPNMCSRKYRSDTTLTRHLRRLVAAG